LIVDDEPVVRLALTSQLREQFTIVGEAGDATGAVALARGLRPDLALIDVEMPGGGLYATEILHEELPQTTLVILSMDTQRSSVLRFLHAGAAAYLRKGMPGKQLAARLNQVLAVHRRADERLACSSRKITEQVRSALVHADVGVAVVKLEGDNAGQVSAVNSAYAQMLGRDPAELIGHSLESWTHPNDLPEDLEHPLAVLSSSSVTQIKFEVRYLHRCEYVVPVTVTAKSFRDYDGALAAFIQSRPR
jgi:two-component system response regulator DesR